MEVRRCVDVMLMSTAPCCHSSSISLTTGGRKASAAPLCAPFSRMSIGAGSRRDSRHAPRSRSRATNVPEKLRRIFGFICLILRAMDEHTKLLPGMRDWRMVWRPDLCMLPGIDALPALVVPRLGKNHVAAELRGALNFRACRLNVMERAVLALIWII